MEGDNAWEAARQANITANQQFMINAGLGHAAQAVRSKSKAVRPASAARATRRPSVLGPSRRSARAADKPAPSYRESEVFAEQSRNASATRRSPGHRARPSTRIIPDTVDPGYSRAAVDAALEAADELCDSVDNFAMAKTMTQSMVSNGYWMGQSRVMVQHLGDVKNDHMKFETPDMQYWDDFPHALPGTEPPIWDVVWHPRDKGPGFSGGWRGFATDMELKVGDAVAWEVLDMQHVRAHIFRAAHYETDPLLRATAPGGSGGGSGSGDDSGGSSDSDEDLEVRPSGYMGSPGSDSGASTGTNEAGDATPPASPQQKRSRAGSPDGASGPATDAAEAPSPKRARVVAADALADGTDAAERGAVGTAADDAAPASPAAAAAAQAAGAAVSPQAAWPADSRQAQVTDFMGQRKPRDGDAHPAAKDCAGKAPLQRPKRTSNTANPLVRLGPEALSLEGFAPAAGPAAPASGAAALADASTAAAAARQQKRKQREPKRKSGSEAAKSQRRRSGDSAGSSGMGRSKQRSSCDAGASAEQEPQGLPPVQVTEEGEETYYVEGLLDKMVQGGRTLWKVRWLGYEEADDTWETTDCLDMPITSYKWLGSSTAKPIAADC